MKQGKLNLIAATLLVIIAALIRVATYPHTYASAVAMGLFAGAVFTSKKYAFALPIAAMLLSDVLFEVTGKAIGFWGIGQAVNYIALGFVTMLGTKIRKANIPNVVLFSLLGTFIFFFASNLGYFVFENTKYLTYTQDLNGLVNCFIAAIPFAKSGLIADLTWSALLFGTYALVSKPAKPVITTGY